MAVTINDVVRVQITPFTIGKAAIASLWKSGFIRDTFVRDRGAFEKYQRSLMGDYAKLSLKSWLESQQLSVTDWDDVRTSWRSQRKTFDLQVGAHNIEVKSSNANGRTMAEVISQENIIHPCDTKVKEITVQLFFPDDSLHECWLCGWALRDDLGHQDNRSPRRIRRRLVDFFLLSFTANTARPMHELIEHLHGR